MESENDVLENVEAILNREWKERYGAQIYEILEEVEEASNVEIRFSKGLYVFKGTFSQIKTAYEVLCQVDRRTHTFIAADDTSRELTVPIVIENDEICNDKISARDSDHNAEAFLIGPTLVTEPLQKSYCTQSNFSEPVPLLSLGANSDYFTLQTSKNPVLDNTVENSPRGNRPAEGTDDSETNEPQFDFDVLKGDQTVQTLHSSALEGAISPEVCTTPVQHDYNQASSQECLEGKDENHGSMETKINLVVSDSKGRVCAKSSSCLMQSVIPDNHNQKAQTLHSPEVVVASPPEVCTTPLQQGNNPAPSQECLEGKDENHGSMEIKINLVVSDSKAESSSCLVQSVIPLHAAECKNVIKEKEYKSNNASSRCNLEKIYDRNKAS